MSAADILVVAGPCATGKTTLARRLAPLLARPLLAKDDFKERLFEVLGAPGREASRRLGAASFEMIWLVAGKLAAAGVAHVIEYPTTDAAHLAAGLAALRAQHGAVVSLLELTAAPAAIVARIRARAAEGKRHAAHTDLELLDELSRPVPPFGHAIPARRYRLVATDGPGASGGPGAFAELDAHEIARWARGG